MLYAWFVTILYAFAPAPDPLDDLAFIDGCWLENGVDYGYRVCWERVPDAWLGHYRAGGPMGPSVALEFRIARGASGLAWFVDGSLTAVQTVSAPRVALFGTAEQPIGFTLAAGAADNRLWFGMSGAGGDEMFRLSGTPSTIASDANELTDLAALAGCWRYREQDGGYTLCFTHTSTAWIGRITTATGNFHTVFRIERGAHGWQLTAPEATDRPGTWFAGHREVPLRAAGPRVWIFGTADDPLMRVLARGEDDTLMFAPEGRVFHHLVHVR